MSKKISYVIVDDHKLFREGVKLSLSMYTDIECVGEAGNGIELLKLLEHGRPDVVLLDLKMPEKDGVEVLADIKQLYPDLKVVILTMYDDDQYIIHMLDKGANGYLVKDAEPKEIETAIHTVHAQGYYFSEQTSKALLKKVVKNKQVSPKFKEHITLSDRESEVLKLICEEYTNAEIAEKVFLSKRTVEGIRSGMLEKIGVRNTAGLVLYAVKSSLV